MADCYHPTPIKKILDPPLREYPSNTRFTVNGKAFYGLTRMLMTKTAKKEKLRVAYRSNEKFNEVLS